MTKNFNIILKMNKQAANVVRMCLKRYHSPFYTAAQHNLHSICKEEQTQSDVAWKI
jgi:hypothetical protein